MQHTGLGGTGSSSRDLTGVTAVSRQVCDDPDNFTFSDFPESGLFPPDDDGVNYCKFYRPAANTSWPGNCSHQAFTSTELECGSDSVYTYNEFQFSSTVVTDWNLVCGQQIKVSLVISAYFVGRPAAPPRCILRQN